MLVLAACLGCGLSALGAVAGGGQPLGLVLQLEGIEGECALPKHEGWIVLEDVDWDLAGPSAAGSGRVGSGGVPGPVSFLKRIDKSSPLLAEAACKATVVPTARLEFFTLGDAGKLVRFYQVQLRNVQVGACAMEAGDGSVRPIERVTLDFEQVEWTYTEFTASGLALADHRTFWDIVSGEGGYQRIRLGFKVSAATEIGRNGIRLRWLAETGRKYRILQSNLLNGQFTQALPDVDSTGDGEQELWVPRDGPFGFFIITEVDEAATP
ncbi:MAG: type VI secretion system tube protein Hcp [Verrucomicrobiales bacterium]|nr:type VI secretion system tube protein Hcp [Verrucomicrobiales bacterium]